MKATFHPKAQQDKSPVSPCQMMDYAGTVVNTKVWNEGWEGWSFRDSFDDSKALNPLPKASTSFKYWEVARERRNANKALRRKALDAQRQNTRNKKELDSWWVAHFGSAKLLICTDLKFSDSFVPNSTKPEKPTEFPDALCDSSTKPAPCLQVCPVSQEIKNSLRISLNSQAKCREESLMKHVNPKMTCIIGKAGNVKEIVKTMSQTKVSFEEEKSDNLSSRSSEEVGPPSLVSVVELLVPRLAGGLGSNPALPS